MASPVGHALVGYLGYEIAVRLGSKRRWGTILLCVFAATAPDLDFVPGFFLDVPRQFHHAAISHSLGGAGLFTAIMICIAHFRQRPEG